MQAFFCHPVSEWHSRTSSSQNSAYGMSLPLLWVKADRLSASNLGIFNVIPTRASAAILESGGSLNCTAHSLRDSQIVRQIRQVGWGFGCAQAPKSPQTERRKGPSRYLQLLDLGSQGFETALMLLDGAPAGLQAAFKASQAGGI